MIESLRLRLCISGVCIGTLSLRLAHWRGTVTPSVASGLSLPATLAAEPLRSTWTVWSLSDWPPGAWFPQAGTGRWLFLSCSTTRSSLVTVHCLFFFLFLFLSKNGWLDEIGSPSLRCGKLLIPPLRRKRIKIPAGPDRVECIAQNKKLAGRREHGTVQLQRISVGIGTRH